MKVKYVVLDKNLRNGSKIGLTLGNVLCGLTFSYISKLPVRCMNNVVMLYV